MWVEDGAVVGYLDLVGQPMKTMRLPDRTHRRIAFVTGAFGCALRIWQFVSNRSLWLDELAIARNVTDTPLPSLLFEPLAFDQIAPPGFLAATWLLQSAVPDQDWAFRVIPLAASLATLPVAYAAGRRVAGPYTALGALALMSFSPALISIGAVAKQYSLDVFAVAALLLCSLIASQPETTVRRVAVCGLVGGLLLPFSFPSVLVAAGLGLLLLPIWLRGEGKRRGARVLAVGVPWGLSAAVTTGIALRVRSPETADYMDLYWAAGFPPALGDAPLWLLHQFAGVLDAAFLRPYPWPPGDLTIAAGLLALATVGGVLLEGHGRLLVLSPLAVAAVAALAGLYPLDDRVGLFLAPSLAILAAQGIQAGTRIFGRMSREAVALVAAFLLAAPSMRALAQRPPPYGVEHTRPLIRDVAERRAPGEAVWSYYGANPAVAFYGRRFSLGSWDAGPCSRGSPQAYLHDLDGYRGRDRVWIIFTHAIPTFREPEIILGYLRTIGTEVLALEEQLDPLSTAAYLFDLSDPEKLSLARAESFDTGPESNARERLVCESGPLGPSRGPRSRGIRSPSIRHSEAGATQANRSGR